MIFDPLDEMKRHSGLGPRFQAAFAALQNFTPADEPQRRDLLPHSALYALVQRYETRPAAEKKFESHRRYADVHIILAGEEWMYWRPTSTLQETTPYQPERDCTLYAVAEPLARLHATPGTVAVFFPADGHIPGVAINTAAVVRKVVLKVLLD